MKALVYTAPRKIEVREVPRPSPGPGEVLLKVRAVGVCGSEVEGYLGLSSVRVPPLIMGHEIAGEVVAVGPGVEAPTGGLVAVNPQLACGRCPDCLAGRTNLCPSRGLVGVHRPGGFADYVAVPATSLLPLPQGVDPVVGSQLEPVACAVHSVELADSLDGRSIAVIGAGNIGLLVILIAKERGADPIVVIEPNERRRQAALEAGAVAAIPPGDDAKARVCEQLQSRGADVVFEAVGTSGTRALSIELVGPQGQAVWIGMHDHEALIAGNTVIRSEARIVGSYQYVPPDFEKAADVLARKKVDALIEYRRYPLADGPVVFETLLDKAGGVVKAILEPAG